MSCTCLACLEGLRISYSRGGLPEDEEEANSALDWLAGRVDRRAERLAKVYRTRQEVTMRMPTNWKPVAGWFEARGIES